jgi:16S rRNA (cytosine1402-N4)-methyltransferase
MEHSSVMVKEVLQQLELPQRSVLLDCTLGLGGHSLAVLRDPHFRGTVVGFDHDEQMMDEAKIRLVDFSGRVEFAHLNFSHLKDYVAAHDIVFDGVLFDLGVASPHFDLDERGFSYSAEHLPDMRMDRRLHKTAADIVAGYPERDLVQVFSDYGEEPLSKTIAGAIVRRRRERPFTSTKDLATLIERIYLRKFRDSSKTHPATRVFQALRIEVNSELSVLQHALLDAIELIQPGGRIVVISYHSLEDRIVKRLFNANADRNKNNKYSAGENFALLKLLTKKPLVPSDAEISLNPRARSAKMRVAERI